MDTMKPNPLSNIYSSTSEKLDNFLSDLFEENLNWLLEIQDAAQKAFGSDNITLLPKTPSLKRKRQCIKDNTTVTDDIDHASTFVDIVKTKKLKIDDISSIAEECLPKDELNESKRSMRLRNRKKKSSLPVRRSKRNTGKKKSYIKENSVKEVCKQSQVIFVKDTPSPFQAENKSTNLFSPTSPIILESTKISTHDVSHTVQPRVAALIEKLKNSAQKASTPATNHDVNKTVVSQLNFNDDDINELEISITLPGTNQRCIQQEVLSKTLEANTPECSRTYTFNEMKEHFPTAECTFTDSTEQAYSKTVSHPADQIVEKSGSGICEDIVMSSPKQEIQIKKSCVQEKIISTKEKHQESDSGLSSDDNYVTAEKDIKSTFLDHDDNKDSEEKELPKISTPQNSKPKKLFDPIAANIELNNIGKGPKILKPVQPGAINNIVGGVQSFVKPAAESKINNNEDAVRYGNIIAGVKSFLKKTDSPRRDTEEEKQRKRAADLKKREAIRQKALDEQNLKKQKILDQRKRLREEKEKRFAEQKIKRIEEEERKKQQIELKLLQASKNQEEIRKLREQQDMKKREVRELKMMEAEHRRLKEEDEQRQKVLDQIEDENRRAELMQKKAEHEEQERHKRKLENEKLEKERLRLIEEERIMHENRKIREFEEKEQHRLQVEKKLKEERERERLERVHQEERLRRAEKEIEDAKKREYEREKAKEKLRNEINTNIKLEKTLKGNNFNGKVLVKNLNKNEQKLNGKENFKSPGICSDSAIKSPAAYQPKIKKTFNPPKVPMMIRESVYTSYGIDDLSSEDSTDDECEPTKRIPSWAQGQNLKIQLQTQFYTNIDPDDIFINCNHPCRLDKIFQKKKERYFKRTSSAHWTSPILRK